MVWGFFWVHLPARGPLLASPWLGTEGTSPAVPPPGCPPHLHPFLPCIFPASSEQGGHKPAAGTSPVLSAKSQIPAAPWGCPRGALGSAPFHFAPRRAFTGKILPGFDPASLSSAASRGPWMRPQLGGEAAASKPREGGGESGFRATRRRGCKVILGGKNRGGKGGIGHGFGVMELG